MISDLFFSGIGFVLCALVWIASAAMRAAGREDAAALEAERVYDSGQPGPAPADGAAYSDDDYPAQPAIGPPPATEVPAAGQERLATAADDPAVPVPAGDRPGGAAAGVHALAAVTEGETIQEEIDRLEDRLTVLYRQMADEAQVLMASDEARIQQVLDAGLYALAEWLPAQQADPWVLELAGAGM